MNATSQTLFGRKDGRDALKFLWNGILLFIAIAMLLAQFIVSPNIVSDFRSFSDYLMKLVLSVTTVGLMAVAVTLVMIAGNLDLSVGSTMTLAAVISCSLSSQKWYDGHPGLTILAAVVAPILIGLACGALNGLLVGTLKLSPFISTLGTMYIYAVLAMAYRGGAYENGRSKDLYYAFLGRGSIGPIPVSILFLVLVFVGYGFLLHRTTFGRRVFAVGGNPRASRFSGIDNVKVVFMTYLLAGLMAGIAGLFLSSWTMSADMSVGRGKEFEVITAIILGGASLTGGKGTMVGTVFGILFMGVLRMFYIQFSVNPIYQFLAQGLILMSVVLLNNYVDRLRARAGR